MKLVTDKNLKMLKDDAIIPANAKCYGWRMDGTVGWAGPGTLKGERWTKYDIRSPSIILIPVWLA